MITPLDIQALGELLNRTLMSTAEALFASDLCRRLAVLAAPAQPEAAAEPPAESAPPEPQPTQEALCATTPDSPLS